IVVRRGKLAGLEPKTIFLKRDLLKAFGILEERGKNRSVLFEALALSAPPFIFELDARQLAQHGPVERMTRLGEKVGQLGRAVARLHVLEHLDKVIRSSLRFPRLRIPRCGDAPCGDGRGEVHRELNKSCGSSTNHNSEGSIG